MATDRTVAEEESSAMAPRREGLEDQEVGQVVSMRMEEWMLIRRLRWNSVARFAVADACSLGRLARDHGEGLARKMRSRVRDRGPRLCWLLRLGRLVSC